MKLYSFCSEAFSFGHAFDPPVCSAQNFEVCNASFLLYTIVFVLLLAASSTVGNSVLQHKL
jgi:hypothetical protein